jgi:two-component system, OmpR family, sensor kinase
MTAAFALAMVLVLSAAAVFVYLRQRADLTEAIDNGLRSRSNDVAVLIGGSDGDLEEVRGNRLASSEASFVQVLAPDGRRLDRTGGPSAPALSREDAQRASRGATLLERRVQGAEGTARMLARPVKSRGRTLVVVAGASLEDRDETLAGLRTSFLIGGSIAVLLASGIGYLLATAGLAPIEAMRRRAKQVSLTRGGERLPLPAAQDEVRRLGETLNEMLVRLEESFDRERRFVADASHELRTPLAVLKAELEAAIRTGDYSGAVHESLVAALDETDHLAQLAEDLLLIARAADGRLPVRREQVQLGDLLERTRQRFADRARAQGRAIRVEAPAGSTASVDPLRARQALGNLVDNALRHGAGDILLSGRETSDAVEIDVHDEGPGFAADLAPHAFERFAGGAGERTRSGAGLGLAIVRAIAEAHGGTATIVDIAPGATVRLRFPRDAESPDSARTPSAPTRRLEPQT